MLIFAGFLVTLLASLGLPRELDSVNMWSKFTV